MDEPNPPQAALPKAFTDEPEPTGVTVIDDVRIARTFGPYRILRHIAAGSVGVVYEAEDPALDKQVAVKFLPEVVRRVPEGNEGLFADARAASALDHPGIARIYDVGRSGGACFFGMDLLQPRSAAGYLRDKGRLSWTEATAVAVDVSAALEAAHGADVLHRDIKPANVLCTDEGVVQLVDFGLAREFPRRGATDRAASPYASPEQLAAEPLDSLSDIYALGATYYALLTGDPPPRVDAPPDPRDLVPEIPEACARIIARAMAKEPAERYRSARELRADLEAALRPAAGIVTARHFAVAVAPSDPGAAARPSPPPRVMIASRSNELRPEPPATPKDARTTARSASSSPAQRAPRTASPELAAAPETPANPWKLVSILLTVALAGLLLARLLGRG
ncbi:MAG: protein kinase [Byssovorax sp.]